jgi:hypothetical protein
VGHQRLEAQTHANLGNAYGLLGDTERNLAHERAAMAVFRQLGARRDVCLSHLNIGRALIESGEMAAARAELEMALAITSEHGLRADRVSLLRLYERVVSPEQAATIRVEIDTLAANLVAEKVQSDTAELAQSATRDEWLATVGPHSTLHGIAGDDEIDVASGLFSRVYLERWYRDFSGTKRDRRIGVVLIGIEAAHNGVAELWRDLVSTLESDLRVDAFGVALSPQIVLIALPDFTDADVGRLTTRLREAYGAFAEHGATLWLGDARGDSTDSLASLLRRARDHSMRLGG